MVTVHVDAAAAGAQAPVQPARTEPAAGVAVNVTSRPAP
jgi:hypothetical protein